jgi:hypothetical protein
VVAGTLAASRKIYACCRCHAENALSAGVFRRENIRSVPSSFGSTRVTKTQPQEPWFGYNLGLWSDED